MNDVTPASGTPLPEPDLTGRELGDFRLLRRLGRGGMAEVYLAEQVSLGRQVAMKVLKSSLVDDGSYVRRFHHEARAAAALVHANIVQVHEVGCIEGVHFIAQEYVPGQNLKQIVSRQGPLELPAALLILRQVAAALSKSGQQGIVHRDIKPENIMLGPEGEVKVADFGLARVIGNGEMTSMTQVGVTMGTPLYMSPEQVEGKPIDTRSDLYSLGVTMYYVLTGRPPFEGESALAVAMQHVRNKPGRLELARPDLPEGVCRLIHRLLAKEPDERFANAAELLSELRGLRVEGLEEGWYEESGDWGFSELAATSQVHSEATQELTVLMKEASGLHRRRGIIGLLVAGIVAAFLTGALITWMRQPTSLLAPDPTAQAPSIEKRDSVQAQYLYAVMAPSETAWQSVWKYFPPADSAENRYYQRRAQHQLGWLYLNNGQYDQAMEIFDDLAALPNTEKQFRAIGLAGQAAVYSLRGEYEQSQGRILDARALFNELDTDGIETDRQLREELRRELERFQNRNESGLAP